MVGGCEQLRCIGEPPQSGRRGDVIDWRAASDKRSASAQVPERESRHQGRSPLSRATRFDGCAKIQQRFDQRDLHSGLRG